MQNIKQLMIKAGLSDDVADNLCESFVSYKTSIQEQLQSEFDTKLKEIKAACLSETEKHKQQLTRRVQIFLETKGDAVQQQLTKIAADRGTAAEAKLEKISNLVEGYEHNGQSNGDLNAENDKLKRVVATLSEQRDLAVKKANRLQSIAGKALERNRLLETSSARSDSRVTEQTDRRRARKSTTNRPILEETLVRKNSQGSSTKPASRVRIPRTPDDVAAMMG